jgi:hypothetical protein
MVLSIALIMYMPSEKDWTEFKPIKSKSQPLSLSVQFSIPVYHIQQTFVVWWIVQKFAEWNVQKRKTVLPHTHKRLHLSWVCGMCVVGKM